MSINGLCPAASGFFHAAKEISRTALDLAETASKFLIEPTPDSTHSGWLLILGRLAEPPEHERG